MNTLHLKEIKVTGLPRLSDHQIPKPFAVVSIDGDSEGAYTTNKIRRTCNPCWTLDITKSFRASSKFSIEVFRTDSGLFRSKTQHLLGKLSIKITDLIENDTSFPLKDESGADKSARVAFKLTIQTDEAADVDSNNADAQVGKALEVAQMVTSWDTPLGRAVQSLEQIMNIVGGLAELHPIAKAAWTILTSVYKVMQRQMYQDDEIRGLAEGLQDTLALVNECSDLRRIKGATDVISEISRAVLEAASLIDEYAQLSLARRTLRSVISVNLSDRIKSCRSCLSELSTKFDRTVAIETRMIVKAMQNEFFTKQQIDLLDRLPRVAEAKYDAARCCLADTRKAVIDTIIDWVSKTEDDTKVFWLYGLAGMGKSTIATSVSCALNALGHLGATFFFSRDVIARSGPDQLFSTITFQMAPIDPSITAGICKALHLDLDIGRSAVANQFEGLIKNPLRDLKHPGHPLVVLLDALDECGSEKQRRGLLAIIQNELPSLPHFVKFIITSRPEADIRTSFMSMGPLVQSFDLSTVQNRLVDADILAFISNRMAGIAQFYDLATDDWPGDDRRHALVQRAAGLFVWASTACEFIDDDQNGGPEEQLKLVLNEPNISSFSTSPWTTLDSLYLQVLQQSVPATASNSRADDLHRIVGSMVAVANPLSPLDLEQLLGMSNPSHTSHGKVVRNILRKLHSVVIVPQADEGTLRIIHPSFVDFITNRNRCIDDRFHIDLPAHRHHLAKRCLMRMQECLRRDICRLGTGPVMNVDIPDKRIANFILGDLRYACCYWAEHLHRSVIDEELYAVVRVFIFEHLLHWFEVIISKLASVRTSLDTFLHHFTPFYSLLHANQLPDDESHGHSRFHFCDIDVSSDFVEGDVLSIMIQPCI